MSRKIELLAPGGDVEAIKAAIVAGANAVYCGLDMFNARNRASNLSFDELNGVLRLAHEHSCEVFLTLNVVILEHEVVSLVRLLNKLVNSGIDGIIVQDLGVFNIVKKHFPTLDIHASTQLTTHNEGQILFLHKIGATRVNLSRELNLGEIKQLTTVAHDHDVLTEVFVHGALCIAFSGQCYSSSVSVGNSGNRGRCSQACRDEYEVTAEGHRFPLNLKDNSAYFDLPQLVDAGVDSLKVEGRIKGAHYVYTVVDTWRKQINNFVESGKLLADDGNLHKVFNRSFTNSFLQGDLNKKMFTDNPRDNSVNYAVEKSDAISVVQIHDVKQDLYTDKNALGAELAEKIKDLSIDKIGLTLVFTAKENGPLTVNIMAGNTSFEVKSDSVLRIADEISITPETVEKRFRSFNNATFDLAPMNFDNFDKNLTVPFKELTELKNQVAFLLNGSRDVVKHVDVPALPKHPKIEQTPKLSLLIANVKDLHLADVTDADIYFKIPESLKKNCPKHIKLLQENPRLIPWFPAVLIGKDYLESVKILEEVKPKRIVTNNTGIAYKAFEMGIEWVAGPFLNTTNSHALLTLQEELNCAGAFISNEINRGQIRNITRPKNFKMFYSIYHPILMMTSRQCFFQQTVGCKKPAIEDGCMLKCEKATTITNVKGISFAVDKQKGGYPSIYNDEQFLNFDVVNDFSDLFDEFFIDLTNIGAGSKKEQDKVELIKYFESLLAGDDTSKVALNNLVPVATNAQYTQGL
ncbi:peptidase U32 family protein [Moritella viscosa]|uniref:Putative collagenase family protease n=1 Tax=Moritella viscosa TaxID=80854 RepID=A0A1L0BV82_9GAMM|nr:peptidase U32 family protein [Moritella viscosa]SGZ09586.1 Putative collagenase family protease [Moritella viscosa]SHO11389.1 Putative collagenase family protease [Moritella viscosa]SHO11391.1 Putative collagenase family protease [Moritella viscosa]SHO16137.1 Putative collagenase family protease [Moritella viscosa]SHO17929.1 Putative collagenase family protease [Moritella viscosa]